MVLIEFDLTPNPNALRVKSGQKFTNGAVLEIDRLDGSAHPLAAALLAIDGVERVMLARDFVTIVRQGPAVSWEALRPEVALALTDCADVGPVDDLAAPRAFAGEVEEHIEQVLDRYVRPYLASDGGEAVLTRFDAADGTAWVRMGGACGGCPSGVTTLKRTIESTIVRWVPEVKHVRQIGDAAAMSEDPKARFRKWVERKWGRQAARSAAAE